MVQKLREILLTKYIGSILIALFFLQSVVAAIELIVRSLFWSFYEIRHTAWETANPPYAWDRLVFSVVTMALYVCAAYGLAVWLYPQDPQSPAPSEDDAQSSES